MSFDLAKLRYEIDSSQTVKAAANLKAMNAVAKGVEATQQRLGVVSTKAGKDTERAYREAANAAKAAQGATRNYGFAIQNASFQVADFFVQVGAGTDAMRAASMQLPQLLGAMGVWGAVAGGAVAAGGALAPMLFDGASGAKSLEEGLRDAEDVLSDFRQATLDAQTPLIDLREEYGRFANTMRDVYKERAKYKEQDTKDEIAATLKGLQEDFDELTRVADTRVAVTFDKAEKAAIRLSRTIAQDVRAEFEALQATDVFEKQIPILERLREKITNLDIAHKPIKGEMALQKGLADELNEALNDMRETLGKAADTSDKLSDSSDGVDFSHAASSAGLMAAELERSYDALSRLLNSTGSLQLGNVGLTAQLEALQSGMGRDEAAMMGKIAKSRAEMGALAQSGAIPLKELYADQRAYEEQLREEVGLQGQINAIIKERTQIQRASKKKPSLARLDPLESKENSVEDKIRQIQMEIETLGMGTDAVGRYRAEYEALRVERDLTAAAMRTGGIVDPNEKARIDEIVGLYRKESLALVDLRKQREAMDTVRGEFGSFVFDMKSGLMSGEGFWESWRNAGMNAISQLTDRMLNQLLDAMFQVNSAGSGAFGKGGGLLGGLLGPGFLFGNGGIMSASGPLPLKAYSKGGIATGPQLALYGEGRQNEAYVPLPDGRTIPVTMNVPPMQSGGLERPSRIKVDVGVSVDDDGRLQAYVKSVSQQTSNETTARAMQTMQQELPGQIDRRVAHVNTRGY